MSTKTIMKPTHLIDPTLYAQVIELENIKAASKALKAKEEELKELITAKMYDMEMVEGTARVVVENELEPKEGVVIVNLYVPREITLSMSTRRTLNKESLLENGVSPEVIAKSTDVSEFTVLKHKKIEETKEEMAKDGK